MSKRPPAPAPIPVSETEDLQEYDPKNICAVIGCPNTAANEYTTDFGITVRLCRGHALVVGDAEKTVSK